MKTASRTASAVMVALVVSAFGAGCSKDLASSTTADDVGRQVGVIGTPVNDFGVQVAVLRIDYTDQSNEGFPRLTVTVRSQNKRTAPAQNPDLLLRCDHSKDSENWFATSTWEPNGDLPTGQVAEGQVIVSFPSKVQATNYPVASCAHARIVITAADPANQAHQLITTYPVDDSTVQAAINADRE